MKATSANSVVNWGIVGLGDVTIQKSGPAFYKCDNSKLVAVMRRTPGAAQAWVRDHKNVLPPTCKGYSDLKEFLNHPDMTAVYVATPPGSHLQVVREIAASGKDVAVYVEKPVGRCAWETEEMVRLVGEKRFYSAYISRAYERTQAVWNLLQQGAVGDRVTDVTYTLRGSGGARGMSAGEQLPWRLKAEQSGGGLIMDVGCHVVDRIDYLLGPLQKIKGEAQNRNSPHQQVEDYVELEAEIGTASWPVALPSTGAKVTCTWDFESQDSCDELIIRGPKGSVRMAAMSPSLPVQVLDSNGAVVRELTFKTPEHTAQPLIQLVTNELLRKDGAECPSRGDNAIRTSRALDTVLLSYYGGREDEFWLRPETWPGRPKA